MPTIDEVVAKQPDQQDLRILLRLTQKTEEENGRLQLVAGGWTYFFLYYNPQKRTKVQWDL